MEAAEAAHVPRPGRRPPNACNGGVASNHIHLLVRILEQASYRVFVYRRRIWQESVRNACANGWSASHSRNAMHLMSCICLVVGPPLLALPL